MDKKIIISIICSIMLLTFAFGNASLGQDYNTAERFIKIGLKTPLRSKNIVNLKSETGFSFMTENDNLSNKNRLNSKHVIVKLDNNYHIETSYTFNTYDNAMKVVNNLISQGLKAYSYYDGAYRVVIGHFRTNELAKAEIPAVQSKVQGNLKVMKKSNERIFIKDIGGQILLAFNEDSKIHLGANDKNVSSSIVQVEKRKYRGYITFTRSEDRLHVINYINLEQYLFGVVPREMPGSWPVEALKAQSVAARNYTLRSIGKHWRDGYDLCDTTHCQVYGGHDSENIRSNRAVIETMNKVLTYDGKLTSTFYHSSSGGATEDSENVWTYEIPYLRGVKDEFSLGSPNDYWKYTISKGEVKEVLKENGIDVGELIEIVPAGHSEHGRVIKLAIIGKKGIYMLEKDKTRAVFGYNRLKSTKYDVESQGGVYVMSANDKTPKKLSIDETSIITGDGVELPTRGISRRDSDTVTVFNGNKLKTVSNASINYIFEGSGWGHGLGMSQWGARHMAEEGYTYEQILQHYYTGTIVE